MPTTEWILLYIIKIIIKWNHHTRKTKHIHCKTMFKILNNKNIRITHTLTLRGWLWRCWWFLSSLCMYLCVCCVFFKTKLVACHTPILLSLLLNISGSHLFIVYQPWKLCRDFGCMYCKLPGILSTTGLDIIFKIPWTTHALNNCRIFCYSLKITVVAQYHKGHVCNFTQWNGKFW